MQTIIYSATGSFPTGPLAILVALANYGVMFLISWWSLRRLRGLDATRTFTAGRRAMQLGGGLFLIYLLLTCTGLLFSSAYGGEAVSRILGTLLMLIRAMLVIGLAQALPPIFASGKSHDGVP